MQKKLRFKFLKILILAGLLSIEGLAILYAQENTENIESESKPSVEDHNTEDLEKLLKRYNTDSEKILEDSSKLHNIQEGEARSEVDDSAIDEMQQTDQFDNENEASPDKISESRKTKNKLIPIDQGLSNSVRLALSEVQKLSEEELLKRLDEASKDSPARPYFDRFPNIPIFSIKLIKDKESIPSIVKILENKDKLIWFSGFMILTIGFGYVLKRVMHREGRSFIRSFFYFFIRIYIMLILRIGLIYYFYHVEFSPAAKVFKATFMN